MKKLVLSLVLTLGVSGVTLANNGNGEKEKQPVKKEVVKKKATPEQACSHHYRMDVIDCNGVRHRGQASTVWGDCEGTPSGGMIMHIEAFDLGDFGLC